MDVKDKTVTGWFNPATGRWDKEQPSVQTELPVVHTPACAFAGKAFDRYSADHEWCCCDPDGSRAQAILDYLVRSQKARVLHQRRHWWPKGATEPIRVKDMSVRYKRNVLAFLERRADRLKQGAEWELAGVQMNGEHAQDSIDQMLDVLMRTSTLEWFNDLPLIKRLRRDIRRGRGGPIG